MDPITIATIIAAAAAGAASKAIAEGIKSFLGHRKGTSKIELIGPTGEKTMMSPQEVSNADPASIKTALLREMLSGKYRWRSLERLQAAIGSGPEETRDLLLKLGARGGKGKSGREIWTLTSLDQ